MLKENETLAFAKNSHFSNSNKGLIKRLGKTVHAEKKVKCNICNRKMTKKSLRRHSKEVHGMKVDESDKNDENENGGESEKGRLEGKKVKEKDAADHPCEVLYKVELSESNSEGEKNVVLSFQGVECQICKQTYSNEITLKKHVYNVHRMIRVKCRVCEKEVNKKSLDRHMKSVHSAKIPPKKERKPVPEEEKIPCVLCTKKCLNLMSLQNHVKNIHEAEQFKCSQCDFQGIRRHLEKHVKKHHNDEIYQCTRCQKILKSKSTLKEHMWIHTDHRRFICDICGMRFKRTSNYHGHLKSHQDKKFQCQLCGNFFLRKRYLAVHEQTIHNYYGEGVPPQEKGYQCEVCGVKLKWKNNLMAHMRIHTGEKPYKCKICGDDFTCHGSLRTHMAKHGKLDTCL